MREHLNDNKILIGEDQTNIQGAGYITPADSLKHKCLSW